MLQFDRPQIERLITVDADAANAVRDAYVAISDGRANVPPVGYLAFQTPRVIVTSNTAISPGIRSLPSRLPRAFTTTRRAACPPAPGLCWCFRR
jgi:hypothetical protein